MTIFAVFGLDDDSVYAAKKADGYSMSLIASPTCRTTLIGSAYATYARSIYVSTAGSRARWRVQCREPGARSHVLMDNRNNQRRTLIFTTHVMKWSEDMFR